MTPAEIAAAAVAAAALGYPHLGTAYTWATGLWQGIRKPKPPLPMPPEEAVAISYATAITDLASVRSRLKVTACLQEEQMAAIDILTLALVAGSDQ